MERKYKVLYTIIALCFFGTITWGVYITDKQTDFSNECQNICLVNNQSYETTFNSWGENVNGKCFCQTEGKEINK